MIEQIFVKNIVKPPKNDQKIPKRKSNYEKVITYSLLKSWDTSCGAKVFSNTPFSWSYNKYGQYTEKKLYGILKLQYQWKFSKNVF